MSIASARRLLLHKVWTLDKQLPIASVEHRFAWRYLVGFVHPASGRTIFHLSTSVSIALFEIELEAFAAEVGAGPHKQIVLVLGRAGWHASLRLRVPEHIHLLFLPPYSPELQPAEHVWPLTNTVLVNRHFASIDELEDVQAARVIELCNQQALVRSATLFSWYPSAHSPQAWLACSTGVLTPPRVFATSLSGTTDDDPHLRHAPRSCWVIALHPMLTGSWADGNVMSMLILPVLDSPTGETDVRVLEPYTT